MTKRDLSPSELFEMYGGTSSADLAIAAAEDERIMQAVGVKLWELGTAKAQKDPAIAAVMTTEANIRCRERLYPILQELGLQSSSADLVIGIAEDMLLEGMKNSVY